MFAGGMYWVDGLSSPPAMGDAGAAGGGAAAGFDSSAGTFAVAPLNSSAPGTLKDGRCAAIMSRSCWALMATVPDSVRVGDGAGGAGGAAGFGAGAGAGAAATGRGGATGAAGGATGG